MFKNYYAEMLRKDKLLYLFEDLEHKVNIRAGKKGREKAAYRKLFQGTGKVDKINPWAIRLKRETGEKIGWLAVNAEIAGLMKKGDSISLKMGLKGEFWHLIRLEFLGSDLGGQTLVSGRMKP